MKRLGSSLSKVAIPFAVQSGCVVPAFALQLSLRCQPLETEISGSCAPGFRGSAAPSSRAIPWRQASRFRPTFQVLFCREVRFCRGPMLHGHALFSAARARGTPLRSGRGSDAASPAAANSAVTGSAWPTPSSTISRPPGASNAGAARRDRAIEIEPVAAAVERKARIEVAHVRRQSCDVAGRDIGRVGDDQSNGPRKASAMLQATNVAARSRDSGHCRAPLQAREN